MKNHGEHFSFEKEEREELERENYIELLLDVQRAVNAHTIVREEWVRLFPEGAKKVSICLDFLSENDSHFLAYVVSDREIKKELLEDKTPKITTHDLNVIEHYLEVLKNEKSNNNDKIIQAIRSFRATPKGKLFEIFGANKGSLRF